MDDKSLVIACPNCHRRNRVPAERLDADPNCGHCHEPLFAGKPVALDAAGFAAHVEGSDLPVLVDFWAPWCGPCLGMAPQFEAAAKQLEPAFRLAKIDTQAHPDLGARFGIRSIPTLVLFNRGQPLASNAGAMPAAAIVDFARRSLAEAQ